MLKRPVVCFCFPSLGFRVSFNSKVNPLFKLWNDCIACFLRCWGEFIFWNEALLLFVFASSLIKTQVTLVHQSKNKNKKIPLVPGQEVYKKQPERIGWMSELPQSIVIVNGNRIWGKDGEKERGKKTYQGHICHWLNGKGDYKDIFIVWNDISENWRLLHGGSEPLSSCSSAFFLNISTARAEKFNAAFLLFSWQLDPKPLEHLESHPRH